MQHTRVGVVGAGGIASRHIGNLMTFADVRVVAITDPERDRAEAQAARCGAAVAATLDELLVQHRLDALYICVPPFAHGEPELRAAELGIPFFVEKPLSVDGDTAERIAAAVAARGLVTAVGYHWRYLDITERAHALLRETPPRLVLGYWIDGTPPPAWWRDDARSGGQMVEQTTHVFDLARLLVGEVSRVTAISARTDRPAFPDATICDVSAATLEFSGGAIGTVASTCLLTWPHRIGLHLFGEGLAMELSEFELMVDVGQGRPVQRAEGDPFVREDRDFINAVQGKPNCIRAPYAEAMQSHRLALAATESARTGQPVTLTTTVPHD